MKHHIKTFTVICLAAAAGFLVTSAYADGSADIAKPAQQRSMEKMITTPITAPASAPASTSDVDNEVIRITPDSSKIVHLDQDAASVIVNNPRNIGVALDNPRLLVIMPKQPGTTFFTVLNASGKTIMERRVIVTGTQKKYIRVRRMCGNNSDGCAPSSYYYCPDGCYEVNPVAPVEGVGNVPEIQGSAPQEEQHNAQAEPIAPAVSESGHLNADEQPQTVTPEGNAQ